MKIGKGYLIIILGLSLILLNFLLKIKQDNPRNQLNNGAITQQGALSSELPLFTQDTPVSELPLLKPGITLLETNSGQLESSKLIKVEKAPQKKDPLPEQNHQSGESIPAGEDVLAPAGITVDDSKMPSKKRLEEMNSKGIIIY